MQSHRNPGREEGQRKGAVRRVMGGIWPLGLIHRNYFSNYNTEGGTASEPPLLVASIFNILICVFVFPMWPSISFTPSIPPSPPDCPALWVTDMQAEMCLLLCTSRMFLPSGAVPSVCLQRAARRDRNNPQDAYCSAHTRTPSTRI